VAIFTKRILSGSANGRPIKVTGTATGASVTVHQAVAGTSDIDEVYLYACNTGTAAVLLTIEWGGTSDPDDHIQFSIPGESGLYCIAPGLVLQNELNIKAFAASADVITLVGFVNRITT
jgi:hypothetical protein